MKSSLNYYFRNGLLAIVIFLLIMAVLIKWLDKYTMHNQEVEIPNIKWKNIKEVDSLFKKKKLNYLVIDSVFVNGMGFGRIIETIPSIGTKVKPWKTVLLTLSSYNDLLLSIPDVKNTSKREAQFLLESAGFQFIKTKIVSGNSKNLVLGLEEENGCKLNYGDRFSAFTIIVILVCSGPEETLFSDTVQ